MVRDPSLTDCVTLWLELELESLLSAVGAARVHNQSQTRRGRDLDHVAQLSVLLLERSDLLLKRCKPSELD